MGLLDTLKQKYLEVLKPVQSTLSSAAKSYSDFKANSPQSPVTMIGPLALPNIASSQVKNYVSQLSTPQGQTQYTQKYTNPISRYVANRYAGPISQIPYNANQIATNPSLLAKGKAGFGLLSGVASLIPDPLQDVAMPAYDYLKGVAAARQQGVPTLKSYTSKTAIDALTGQNPVGVGDAFVQDPKLKSIANLAELPLMIAATHSVGKNKKFLEQIRQAEPEILSTLHGVKNLEKFTPETQMGIFTDVKRIGNNIIPSIMKSEDMKILETRDPVQWAKAVSVYLGDRLMQAKAPKVDFGFSVKNIQRVPDSLLNTQKDVENKVRGFAKTISESPGIPQEVKNFALSQTYEPLKNINVLETVSKVVKRGDSEAISFAKNDATTYGNATAMVMLRKLIDKGRFDEANDLISAVSPRFTKQGQSIQILSQFGRLKPEGAIRYAQNLIDKANEANPRLNLKLTPENSAFITQQAKALESLADGSREKIVATAQLIQSIKEVVPPSIGQKISTIQTMAQLLNPKTAIRNTLGNTLFAAGENVSDVVGTGIDKLTSVVTGQRTKTLPDVTAQLRGAKQGLEYGLQDARLGIDTSGGVASQFDLPSRTFTKGILGKLEKALNVELRATDRAAYTAAFEGSLANQMKVSGLTKPTDQMLETAHMDALYRTFQDNSRLAQFFGGVKKSLNKIGTPDGKFGLGDLLLKYPKTPANILSRGLDYSPVGFAKGLYEAYKGASGQAFNQKAFVENLSRSIVGTGLISAGYVLAKNGIITGQPEKDKDIAAVQRATGQGGFKLNVSALKRFLLSGGQKQTAQPGDTLVSYDWAQPNSLQIAMGANVASGAKGSDVASSLLDSFAAGAETLAQQPLVRGITDIASKASYKGLAGATTDAILNSASGFVPSILNQIANALDTTQRDTYDPSYLKQVKNSILSKIPIARQSLQPRIDVFGQEQQNYEGAGLQRLLDIFVNPAFISHVKDNPAAKEVLDIFANSGETQQAPRVADRKFKINGQTIALSPEQLVAYQKYLGQKTTQLYSQVINDPTFQKASDEDKAKLLAGVLTDVNSAAKIELFGNAPKTVSNNVKQVLQTGQLGPVTLTKAGNLTVSGNTVTNSKPKAKSIKVPKISMAKMPTLKLGKLKKLKLAKLPKPKKLKNYTASISKIKLKNLNTRVAKGKIPKIKIRGLA